MLVFYMFSLSGGINFNKAEITIPIKITWIPSSGYCMTCNISCLSRKLNSVPADP